MTTEGDSARRVDGVRVIREKGRESDGSPRALRTPTNSPSYVLSPVAWVESSLIQISDAPCQGGEGAPPAWLVFGSNVSLAAADLQIGEEIMVITWLDRARRDVLRTYPEHDQSAGLWGVFSTRSPDRPNPIGLHRSRFWLATVCASRSALLKR